MTGPVAGWAVDGDESLAIEWQCEQEYDNYFHVRCAAQPAGNMKSPSAGPATGGASSGERNTTPQGSADPDMRPVAMRGHDAIFSAAPWRVPLYALPLDQLKVSELLQSVLCGTALHCSVTYHASAARAATAGT